MKQFRNISIGALAFMTALSEPFQVLAASPSFAYSDETWVSLKDNQLEFDEIADLIHEYNPTVLQNQLDYKEYKDKDQSDIAQSYYNAAQDIYDSIEYPDPDDSNYASRLSSALTSELQADRMMEQGDNNVDDEDIIKLGYDQTEMQLVKNAQTTLINYWTQAWQLERLKSTETLSQLKYQSVQTKIAAGTATQTDLLSAQESVTSARASILSAEGSLKQLKENLCLMTGWSYGADVTLGTPPDPDLASIDSIQLDHDIQKALESNYSLKILRKKIENAQKGSTKESLQESLKNGERSVTSSVGNAYQNLLLSREDYLQALTAYELEQKAMNTAERQLAAGTITRNAYEQQKTTFSTAETSIKTAALALLQAKLDYEWAVNGLASAAT